MSEYIGYLQRMTNNELIKYLEGQKRQLKEMNNEYHTNPRRLVLGGDEPSLFNEVRTYVIPSNIREIEEEMKVRGMEIPAEQ